MTTRIGDPGSTKIPLLVDSSDHHRFVLALHQSAAVGVTAGSALAGDEAQRAHLHTAPGLGDAVAALATAVGTYSGPASLKGDAGPRQ
jgi:benzoylformate decarboxylase